MTYIMSLDTRIIRLTVEQYSHELLAFETTLRWG